MGPTNYLDRDSLGALSEGLRSFGGGVVIVSHSREFANAVCSERWVMENGSLQTEGQSYKEDVIMEKQKIADFIMDEHGNKIMIKNEKQLSVKEQKKLRRKGKKSD